MKRFVIVGAGPTGLSLAHQLSKQYPKSKIIVHEKNDGAGGNWREEMVNGLRTVHAPRKIFPKAYRNFIAMLQDCGVDIGKYFARELETQSFYKQILNFTFYDLLKLVWIFAKFYLNFTAKLRITDVQKLQLSERGTSAINQLCLKIDGVPAEVMTQYQFCATIDAVMASAVYVLKDSPNGMFNEIVEHLKKKNVIFKFKSKLTSIESSEENLIAQFTGTVENLDAKEDKTKEDEKNNAKEKTKESTNPATKVKKIQHDVTIKKKTAFILCVGPQTFSDMNVKFDLGWAEIEEDKIYTARTATIKFAKACSADIDIAHVESALAQTTYIQRVHNSSDEFFVSIPTTHEKAKLITDETFKKIAQDKSFANKCGEIDKIAVFYKDFTSAALPSSFLPFTTEKHANIFVCNSMTMRNCPFSSLESSAETAIMLVKHFGKETKIIKNSKLSTIVLISSSIAVTSLILILGVCSMFSGKD